ncbi:hypothetical protein ABPG72_007041 [Tetrahymena utriculariae]
MKNSSFKFQNYLIYAFIVGLIHGISIEVNNKDRHCFEVQTIEGRNLKIDYQISGEREENVKFELVSSSGQILHETDMRAEYTYNYKAENSMPIIVCFQSQDKKGKFINFNWRNIVEDEYVGIDSLAESVRAAQQANRQLEQIYIFYQRDYQRLVTHTKILKKTSKQIKWGYIFKIVLLIIVAIIEVITIIKPFRKLQEQYQTV